MKTSGYARLVEGLAPLTTFPAEIFVENEDAPQSVCDFVLTLAVIYNELRDLWIARHLLYESKPHGEFSYRQDWGEYYGLHVREMRLTAGMLDELLDLVRKNAEVTSSKCFQSILKRSSPESRRSWEALAKAAAGKKSKDSISRSLALIRNEIGYHYVPRKFGEAFAARFLGKSGVNIPLMSDGENLLETRFYFGDAAAEYYLLLTPGSREGVRALTDPRELLVDVGRALFAIVHHFIHFRCSPKPWSHSGA